MTWNNPHAYFYMSDKAKQLSFMKQYAVKNPVDRFSVRAASEAVSGLIYIII